jgi:hypothetical protein
VPDANTDDQLAQMLTDGWTIEGYSTTIMAAGAMTHSILLRKDAAISSLTVVVNGEKEVGRVLTPITPKPEKKGWF